MRVLAFVLALGCSATAALAQTESKGDAPVTIKTLSGSGTFDRFSYTYEINYPQLDGTTGEFSKLNARFQQAAKKTVKLIVDEPSFVEFNQLALIGRPSKHSVQIEISQSYAMPGRPQFHNSECSLVDLRTGRAAGPEEVFLSGERWLQTLIPLVQAALKSQFTEDAPPWSGAVTTEGLTERLRKSSYYCWEADKLRLPFDACDLAPCNLGSQDVEIPRSALREVLNPNGPLGD